MLIDCERGRNPANEMALVGMGRDLSPADLRAVRAGIGAAILTYYGRKSPPGWPSCYRSSISNQGSWISRRTPTARRFAARKARASPHPLFE
jgi:hypothetical protein